MENNGPKTDKTQQLLGYEWGLTEKGDPISTPNPIATGLIKEKDQLIPLDPSQIEDIEVRSDFKIILTTEGRVFACGYNENGLLGSPETQEAKDLLEVHLPGKPIKSISIGRRHILALSKDGKVWAWGSNKYGQLGKADNPAEDIPKPFQVPGLPEIEQIMSIENSSYALDTSGYIWSWGHSGHIGRTCAGGANKSPQKVTIQTEHKQEVEVRAAKLFKNGKKLVAIFAGNEAPKVEDKKEPVFAEEIKEKEGDHEIKENEAPERAVGKPARSCVVKVQPPDTYRSVPQESDEAEVIKSYLKDYSELFGKLTGFEKRLQAAVKDCKSFTTNPFPGLLPDAGAGVESVPEVDKAAAKTIHIDLRHNMEELENIQERLQEIGRKHGVTDNEDTKEAAGPVGIIKLVWELVQDAVRLRRIELLAFKLHSYHLRLKRANVLNVRGAVTSGARVHEVLEKIEDMLHECYYVTSRFDSLKGEFSRVYEDKLSSVVSRTGFHMLDAVYQECQAWKYVNLMGKYAVEYQTSHDDLALVAEKIKEAYTLYKELKEGEPSKIFNDHNLAVEQEADLKKVMEGRKYLEDTNMRIAQKKREFLVDGEGEGSPCKEIMKQVYEQLVDTGLLRLAYYDLFLSLYETVDKKQAATATGTAGGPTPGAE